MKRLAVCLLAVPLLGWLGFQAWLSAQPEDMQAMLRSLSTREFARIAWDALGPRKAVDFGSYGRRETPGRGHSPWVLRSNLDGQPRMILFALAPEYWLSVHTESGSLHQFWRGEVVFEGPVYDTYHGRQPSSSGRAFFRQPSRAGWRLFVDGEWRDAPLRYLGHSLAREGQIATLHYSLGSGPDALRLSETPELRREAVNGAPAGERVGLERRVHIDANPARRRVAVALPGSDSKLTRELAAVGDGARWAEVLADDAVLTHWFDEPGIALLQTAPAEPAGSPAERAIAASDCLGCHALDERVSGPAWREIAARHADAAPAQSVARLARRIREGGSGDWGQAVMPPHAALSQADSEQIAWWILQQGNGNGAPPSGSPVGAQETAFREHFTWSYASDTEPRPNRVHPAFRLRRIDAPPFTPAVGGLALLGDGRLALSTWDRDGAVFAIEHWNDGQPPRVERIADGLQEPLGLANVGDALYAMQKQELTQLIDADGDGQIDEYRALSADWQASGNFHEFGFGLVEDRGFLYGALSVCVEYGGKSCALQLPDRGRVFRVSLASGALEFVASGFRTPNGLAIAPGGDLYVTDNQGDWLPASKLVRVRTGGFYGWRSPLDALSAMPEADPPALWLPHNEVGNSPTQPLFLRHGPYAGQVIFGDVYNGGIKRAALEEVGGQVQGAAFHFTGGLAGGANRLLEAPDGAIVVGEIGNPGNWSQVGKQWFGLEVLEYTGGAAFEPLSVRATPAGFEIDFTQPLARDTRPDASTILVQDWFYVPSDRYGGPKYDPRTLEVRNLHLSADRRTLAFETPAREAGRIVYLRLHRSLRSETGDELWVNEAWYTLNAVPRSPDAVRLASARAKPSPAAPSTLRRVGTPAERRAPNTLTDRERADGWRLLFDGRSFAGWRNYGAKPGEAIEGWAVEDGALRMTRDTSFLRFAWNFVNPFDRRPLLDLMSEEKFGDFELSIDWKISPGGNSGIFYLVPDDAARVPWKLGVEMQVLDNDGHADGQIEKHRAGDLYDLVASSSEPVRPVGEWNSARIRVEGDLIQHWLNGVPIVDVRRSGPEWEALVAASKFADREGYAQARTGHLTLQDHGDTVWYRNIKLRELAPPARPAASPEAP